MVWLSSRGGTVTIGTREGVSSVIAAAHGIAASVVIRDPSDVAERKRLEIEAIWQLKQLVED